MMHMLYDELHKGAKSMYLDATEVRVFFQKDITIEYMHTITGHQAWNQLATNNHQEDVDELVFQ